jgi:hypothetical protein
MRRGCATIMCCGSGGKVNTYSVEGSFLFRGRPVLVPSGHGGRYAVEARARRSGWSAGGVPVTAGSGGPSCAPTLAGARSRQPQAHRRAGSQVCRNRLYSTGIPYRVRLGGDDVQFPATPGRHRARPPTHPKRAPASASFSPRAAPRLTVGTTATTRGIPPGQDGRASVPMWGGDAGGRRCGRRSRQVRILACTVPAFERSGLIGP